MAICSVSSVAFENANNHAEVSTGCHPSLASSLGRRCVATNPATVFRIQTPEWSYKGVSRCSAVAFFKFRDSSSGFKRAFFLRGLPLW